MKISRLWKVENDSVFYSSDLGAVRQEYYRDLNNGTKVGYATDGSVLDAEEASSAFLLMCDFNQEPLNEIERIYRNIQVADIIIAVVRSELFRVENGAIYLAQLKDAIDSLKVGMFQTAADQLTLVEVNEVLTQERLDRWEDMTRTADAIKE